MVFRQIIFNALLAGIIAGLLLSVAQVLIIDPIIFAAESYEVEHDHGGHDHSSEAWAPQDGGERTAFTVIANICAGIGFAAVLIAIMSQLQAMGVTTLSITKGILWGCGGYVAMYVAPSIGLPPEIPGSEAPALESRQLWWLMAVIGVGVGMLALAFGSIKIKVAGVVAIALPYVVGAPKHVGALFSHPDPQAVIALTALHERFFIVTGAGNLLFWIALGLVSGWAVGRFKLESDGDQLA
jgi:cobalt transporter subunit CbtA